MYLAKTFHAQELLASNGYGFEARFLPPPPKAAKLCGWRIVAKRSLDVFGSLLILALFIWSLFPLVALWIRLDSPGPALFRQRRIGLNGRPFYLWKFRSMYLHDQPPGICPQATQNDARITRAGARLRRFSIDELPQLFNVLCGEMSLVGPRPHAPGTCAAGRPFEQVVPGYAQRHRVKPGMTGLAQVRGWRGETDTEEKIFGRVDADLEYITNWSFRLDLLILLRTVRMLSFADAY